MSDCTARFLLEALREEKARAVHNTRRMDDPHVTPSRLGAAESRMSTRTATHVMIGFDLRQAMLMSRQRFTHLRSSWHQLQDPLMLGIPFGAFREIVARVHPELGVSWGWRNAGVEAALSDTARGLVPESLQRMLDRHNYLNGLYALTGEHLRPFYRHERAKNPAPVVDFRPSFAGAKVKNYFATGDVIEVGELISEGRRMHLLQTARRAQRAAIVELAGFVLSTTARYRKGSWGYSNVGRALARWKVAMKKGESYIDRLTDEIPGALFLSHFHGRPEDADPDDFRQMNARAYMERARKLGYALDEALLEWFRTPVVPTLPAPMDTEVERLAQNARDWIVHDNKADPNVVGGDALERLEDEEALRAAEEVASMSADSPDAIDPFYDPEDDPGDAEKEGGDYDEGYELLPEDFDTHHFLNVDPQHKRLLRFEKPQHEAVECFRRWGLEGEREQAFVAIRDGEVSEGARRRLYPTYEYAASLHASGKKRMPPLDVAEKRAYIRTGAGSVQAPIMAGAGMVYLPPFTIMAYPALDLLREEFLSVNGNSPLGLTEKQKAAWDLYLGGRTHEEIAGIVGITERSLEDRLSGAWSKVAGALGVSTITRSVVRNPMPREAFAWKNLREVRKKFEKIA
jgi:hypothetical protein